MIINIINMVENFDNHKKVDEQNRKIVLQLEAATSLYQMRGFQLTDELDLKNEKVMVLKK